MSERISLSFSPIGHWVVMAIVVLALVALTLWPYWGRIRESHDRRRWLVIGLRMLAVVLAILASLRPSLLVLERVSQKVSLVFLLDQSTSMKIQDEVNNASRWTKALESLQQGLDALGGLDSESSRASDNDDNPLAIKVLRFDGQLHPGPPEGPGPKPTGQQTALGLSMLETVRREAGAPIASIVLLSDGASNQGLAPLNAAQNLRAQGVPVTTIGFGSQSAGASSRDIAVTGLQAPESVFVKNDLEVRATLRVRGFPGQELNVELNAENQIRPVASTTVKVPEQGEVVTTGPLRFTPQVAGETLLTVNVEPQANELLDTNNQYSTFVTVLPGGLKVLHLQGPGTIWEGKYVTRALDASREIQSELNVVLGPPQGNRGALADKQFAPESYDVYILGDIPADYLTDVQHRLLARSVEQGAGLIMLGGRESFGPGGWGQTPVASIMPTEMSPNDGQIEPEGGLKVTPNPRALDNYVLQIGPTRSESQALWDQLPPISGANRLGDLKQGANVWALTPDGQPIMVGQNVGQGRVIAFGGETWPWYRAGGESQEAHRKFWRQAVLWLAHQEDRDQSSIDLALDRRRLPVSGTLGMTAQATNEDGQPITEAQFEAQVQPADASTDPIPVDLYNQSQGAQGSYTASGEPGVYTIEVIGRRPDGQEIDRAESRFLVYQDDRELANPAANIALLQRISEMTGGQFLRPEQLDQFLNELDPESFSRVEKQREYRLWDNWPFLLLFVGVLGFEWWLRKRMGWV